MNWTKWQKASIAVIFATVILVGGYDLVAEYFGGNNSTISVIITYASSKIPAIPFAFGFLMGHWFGQNISKIEDEKTRSDGH
jgi:hypothetical protein